MNILVTGGTGVVGRPLVDTLLQRDHKVTVATRETKKVVSLWGSRVTPLRFDLVSPPTSLFLPPPDVVIHLAANVDFFGPFRSLRDTNVMGSLCLLKRCVSSGVQRFIQASTIEATGPVEKEATPAPEDYPPAPVSSYGESKLEAERELMASSSWGRIEGIVFRLGNLYGPGSSFLIPALAEGLLKRSPILHFFPVFADRLSNPIFITDAVAALVLASEGHVPQGTYFVVGREHVTYADLLSQIAEALGVKVWLPRRLLPRQRLYQSFLEGRLVLQKWTHRADLLSYVISRRGRRIHRSYSCAKAASLWGFSPAISLREGILETLRWAQVEGKI